MDIRLLGEADIRGAKALWKEAFGDSDRFIDWYFANKILPGNSLGMFDERLVSAVHMIPVKICVQGKPLESAFIAGAATAKTRQGQGLMRSLLLETLKLLKSRGIAMTHLYPFRHGFYENLGWATYSYVYNKNVKIQSEYSTGDAAEARDPRLLAPLYSNMMSRFDGYIIRDEREWQWRFEEHMADGGKAALLVKNSNPAAYMLYNSEGGRAEVIETVYNEEGDLHPLLGHILGKGHESVGYFVPATESQDAAPYGMARIVDIRALLKLFGAEEVLKHIRISDGFAGWNNAGEGMEIDIGAFAKMVHLGVTDASACINLLKKVFSPRATCIFEQY